ncbi:hypothetical protein [Hoeflea prorocentri]|uniref:Type I secretion protein n=1 Tax=Hoeflea prorocentri TaxID=1922333 RepID=A0A9X3UHC1_9HYPH|nr:hypothetical protein [Hoeflea prorocentri]MCY6380692.1 hypothetical protein [Hoeflea prorocentri]MDA5398492.1 hypothetical protein [Hoeflea prorocentri]
MDPVTEIIAHFIGVFNIVVEEQRARMDYDEFKALEKITDEDNELPNINVTVKAPHEFVDYIPHVNYTPPPVDLVPEIIPGLFDEPGTLPDILIESVKDYAFAPEVYSFGFASKFSLSFTITPPGSIVVIAKQTNRLTDNDYVIWDDWDVDVLDSAYFDAGLDALLSSAAGLDPIGSLNLPASEEAIGAIVVGIISELEDLSDAASAFQIASGQQVFGIHVNGEKTDAAPKIDAYLPAKEDEADENAGVSFVEGEGSFEPVPLMEVATGGNFVVNEAYIASYWLDAAVFATMGDYVSIDLISQINVWSDVDSFLGSFISPAAASETLAFNIASFSLESSSSDDEEKDVSGSFPATWAVTRIEGNLVFLNWLEQVNLISDHDVTILSSSGTSTTLTTGDNAAINSLSLFELGTYYDLIVVGGDLYHANVINQINVLLDGDYLSSINEFGTSWDGAVSTGNNLLWNQASIHKIGETSIGSMPDAYMQTAENLKNGVDTIAAGVLGDEAFAGLTGLRVLYVEGSIYDLQTILQTNVVGDADQVSVIASELAGGAQSKWDVETGDNDVINLASIVDAGTDSAVYVAGEAYSDAFLHQAELVSDDPTAGTEAATSLANEAVLFLADGMLEPEGENSESVKPVDPVDPVQPDVMQTMLA